MKTCRICGENKEDELFSKNKNSCKKCDSLRQIEYQRAHKDRVNERFRESYKRNKEKINNRQYLYRKNNKDRIIGHYHETSAHIIAVAWFRKNTGLPASEIPSELITVKELQIKLQREIKARRQE